MPYRKSKIFFLAYLLVVFSICLLSLMTLQPIIDGDGLTYVTAMEVWQTGLTPANFIPNRLLNSLGSIWLMSLFAKLTGSVAVGWLMMNVILYFAACMILYFLVKRIFASDRVAFLAGIFFAANYGLIDFGLDYWMDLGGWVAYLGVLWFCYLAISSEDQTENRGEWLWVASVCVGVGSLFKEYAFLGVVPIAVTTIYLSWPKWWQILKWGASQAIIALAPIGVVYWYVYAKFNYTYVDWLAANRAHYTYSSRLVEYFKSLGALYQLLGLLVLLGLYCVWRYRDELWLKKEGIVYLLGILLSILPLLIWPAITQRILFITVPFALLLASFAFKKYEQYWYYFLPLAAIYFAINLHMDSYVLTHINLPF